MIPIFELCLYSLPFHQKKKKKSTLQPLLLQWPLMSPPPHTPQLFTLIPSKTKRTTKHTYKHATLPQLLVFSLSIYQSFIYQFLYVWQVFRMDDQNVSPS